MVHKRKSYSAHIDPPELLVYCKLTQVHMPSGRQICDGNKIVQSFSRFLTIFDFDREYLRKESTYQKSEKLLIIYNPSHVRTRKFDVLWSTNEKLLTLINVHPNGIYSGNYISALTGCCAMKFLYALVIVQGNLSHTRTGTGVPLKNFNREN